MTTASPICKGIVWLLFVLAGLGSAAGQLQASTPAPHSSTPSSSQSTTAPAARSVQAPASASVLLADLQSYIIGNRSRMIQVVTIGFALGIAILVTATRKH